MERKILNSKIFLYLTEFFAGMSVMAVELGASRLLAPYFSSSQIVWTIIIGTIMIAMALGNIYGGRSADRNPNPDRLYARILIAAVWIGMIPVLGKYIILGISALLIFAVNQNFLIIAAFAACMVIFVFPLFLLGTVTPSLVKYSVSSLSSSGRTVGTLGAFNTIGSIIGTFIPTFVTIPAVGTSVTFLIFAGILLALGLIYFISSKISRAKCIVASVLFVVSCVFGHSPSFAFWQEDLTYEGESVYNYLQVYEDDSQIALSTNVLFGVQSVKNKQGGLSGMYYDYAMLAPFMADVENKDELDVLILGMGTGTYATQCLSYFDNVKVTGVEIDDKITMLAKRYFDMPKEALVYTYDGRAYLNASDEVFDVIMVDAYQDITIPFQMSSVEFFTLVRDHLSEDGVMVVNMNMKGKEKDSINDYLADTIASVFTNVYTIPVDYSTNEELFASMNDGFLDNMNRNISACDDETLTAAADKYAKGIRKYENADRIMTDDKAPVELLGMRVIDEIIRDEVEYYKKIYDEKGIQGILESL